MKLHLKEILVIFVLFSFLCNNLVAGIENFEIELVQDDAVISGEVEELRARVLELERSLLEAELLISQLKKQLGYVESENPKLVDDALVLRDDPISSPDAALQFVQNSYTEMSSELSYNTEKEKKIYLRQLLKWKGQMEKVTRDRIVWECDVIERGKMMGDEETITIVIRDYETGERLSNQFSIQLHRRLKARFDSLDLDKPIVLKGVFRTDLHISPDRETAGAFNVPEFVGAFVEYGYRIDIQAVYQRSEKPEKATESEKAEDVENTEEDGGTGESGDE